MRTLVNIANKTFELPKGAKLQEFDGRPHTIAVTRSSKIDKRSNPLGIVGSIDVRCHRDNLEQAIEKLLREHGAKPVSP